MPQAFSPPTQYLNTGEQDTYAWVALDDPAEWPAFSESVGDAGGKPQVVWPNGILASQRWDWLSSY